MASLGGAFTGIRNNAVLQQIFLYQIAGQVIASALAPFIALSQQTSLSTFPVIPLSPADAAEAVLRTVWTEDQGKAEALLSGVNGNRFDVLYKLAGNAPGPEELAVALRRGIISDQQYRLGIAQGRLRNEWGDTIKALAVQQPSPEAALAAYLEGQITEADARAKWAAFGGDPANFDWMFNTQGQAPTPVQALEMANRGIIPWTGTGPGVVSFQQAFLEGPWRNKWLDPFRQIGVYLPPPRTVVAMLRAGSISTALATSWLTKQGLPQEAVAAYIADASAQKTSGSKDLSQTIIVDLYRDRIITKAVAATDLQGLGYDATEANFILAVTDAQISQRFLSMAVSRIHSRYIAWRIDKSTAVKALTSLGVDSTNQSDLLSYWDIERTDNTPTLTPSQIAKAYKDAIIDRTTTYTMLEQHGYDKQTAWIFVSQYLGAKDGTGPP